LIYPNRATQADWVALVAEMSDVQRLVHLTGRMTAFEERDLADRLFAEGKMAYQDALDAEALKLGCPGGANISAGPELSALRARADWAAASVTNTYNYNLAREIISIGEDVPTANRHVYAWRLYGSDTSWDKGYWTDKATEIAQVEMMTVINAGIADFHDRNGHLFEATAKILPYFAVCDLCQEMVDGNPYTTVAEVFRKYILPPHPSCPHHCQAMPKDKLTSRECADLWMGN